MFKDMSIDELKIIYWRLDMTSRNYKLAMELYHPLDLHIADKVGDDDRSAYFLWNRINTELKCRGVYL